MLIPEVAILGKKADGKWERETKLLNGTLSTTSSYIVTLLIHFSYHLLLLLQVSMTVTGITQAFIVYILFTPKD
jgi:hypothetical protein